VCRGEIIAKKRGEKGFGYDPVFVPEGYDLTFAELNSDDKNRISHRGKAMQAFLSFLKDQ
jgi:XTP/dITP diphosphohydrolase